MKGKAAMCVCLVLGAGLQGAFAQASDRWLAAENEASATLPAPRDSEAIAGASLSCKAQRWTLRIVPAAGIDVAAGAAVLDVDGKAFDIAFAADGDGIDARLPAEALEPLRADIRMTIDLSPPLETALGDPVFALRGSRVAIDAVASRCSLRDMDGYTPVTFTPYSSYMTIAQDLRKADIEAFAVSTASQPKVDAAMAEFGGDRRVLFTRLCGSSWYFGASGCNITGFAPDGGDGWRAVYESENVHLFTDPRSASDGWPDIATLPAGLKGIARLWRWTDKGYEFAGELPDEQEPLALRPTVD